MIILTNILYSLRKSVLINTLNTFSIFKKYRKILKINFFTFYYYFFKIWISETLRKKNKSLSNKYEKIFDNDFFFSKNEDWFSHNIPIWDFVIKKEIKINKKIEYLEIGSYEGRSVVYICSEFKNLFATAVDPYLPCEEHKTYSIDHEIEIKYENCKKNLNFFKDRVKIHRLTSNDFFKQNNKKFDLIYVDGSHKATDVKNDFLNSLEIINQNGLIILDDVTWQHYDNFVDNPMYAILPILKENQDLKVISVSNQLIVKKIPISN